GGVDAQARDRRQGQRQAPARPRGRPRPPGFHLVRDLPVCPVSQTPARRALRRVTRGTMNRKKFLTTIVAIGFSVVILYFAFRRIELSTLRDSILAMNPLWALAFAV